MKTFFAILTLFFLLPSAEAAFQCAGWIFDHSSSSTVNVTLKPTSYDPQFYVGESGDFSFAVDSFFFKTDRKLHLYIHNLKNHSVSHSLQVLEKKQNAFVEQQAGYGLEQKQQMTLGLQCTN